MCAVTSAAHMAINRKIVEFKQGMHQLRSGATTLVQLQIEKSSQNSSKHTLAQYCAVKPPVPNKDEATSRHTTEHTSLIVCCHS